MSRSQEAPGPLSLGRNTLWNTCGSFVYLVANWLTTVLVVILGHDYSASGTLAVAMAVGNIFATIILFRVRPVQVSDVDERYSAGEYVCLRIVSTVVGIAFCLAYSWFTVSVADMPVVLVFMVYKGVDSFVDVYEGVAQQHGRLDYPAISQIMRGVLLLVCFVVGLVAFSSLVVAVLLMALSSLAVVVLYDVPKARQFTRLVPKFEGRHLAHLFMTCAPGFVASLACTMVVSIARQQFGLMYGSDALGIYAAVATPTVVVQALVGYLYAPMLVPLAQDWSDGNVRHLTRSIARVLVAAVVVTAGCIVLALLLGELALRIVYGTTIASYAYLLSPMLVCTAVTGLIYFFVDIQIIIRDLKGAIVTSLVPLAAVLLLIRAFYTTLDYNDINVVIILAYLLGLAVAAAFIAHDMMARSNPKTSQDGSVSP